MKGKILFALLFGSLLHAAPLEWQEIKLNQEALEEQVRHQRSELTLMHEKVEELRQAFEERKGSGGGGGSLEKRLIAVEQALAKSQDRLQLLDKQLTCELKNLKNAMESLVAVLGKGESSGKSYIVKSGDSLGKIALDHHTTVKQLKEHNHLKNDQIVVGQKLELP